jgi:hypothetical protein
LKHINHIDHINHFTYISQRIGVLLLHGSQYCMKVLMSSCSDIFSYSILLIFLSSHILIFSYSYLLIFSSSYLLIFLSSHLLIFSFSHLRQGNRNDLWELQVLDESALKTFVWSIFQSFPRFNDDDYDWIRYILIFLNLNKL